MKNTKSVNMPPGSRLLNITGKIIVFLVSIAITFSIILILLGFIGVLYPMHDFLEKIRLEWIKMPDLRFGQLLSNFFHVVGDPFSWEEDIFIEKLSEYMNLNYGCYIDGNLHQKEQRK